MEKNFWGPEQFFPPPCPRHIFEPLVPQKPTKLLGAPKVFFWDPVPVTYSNLWSHKNRQNFPGPQKFFSTILSPSHIRTLGPTKADKTFRGPKSFFHDPVLVTYSNPWSHKSRQNFPGPQKFFSTILSHSHIFEPLVPQKPTKLSGAPKVFFHDPVPVTYSNPWSRSHKSRQNLPGPQKFFCARTHTGTNAHLPTRPPDLDNFLFQP